MSSSGTPADASSRSVKQIRENIREQCYEHLSDKLLDGRDWRDQIELTTGSRMSAESHENRTVLELVQNARDAIRKGRDEETYGGRDGSVAVVVGPDTLYVANTGESFRLNDEEILERVRRLGRGKEEDETIGEKGVGMRSIMALGERFGIHSSISESESQDWFSVDFTSAHPWAMLSRRYSTILDAGEEDTGGRIADELEGSETLDAYVECLEQIRDKLESQVSNYPIFEDSDDWPDAGTIMARNGNETPPSPGEVVGKFPELSPFRYPYVHNDKDDDPVLNTLLGQDTTEKPENESLNECLSEDQYTTVVSVDYRDDARNWLLETFIDAFDDIDPELDVPVEEWREARDSGANEEQQQVWEECKETITAEVLILLEEIENIDLVRISGHEEDDLSESYCYKISDDESPSTVETDGLRSQRVTVTRDTEDDFHAQKKPESVFHLYTKRWIDSPTDDEEDDFLKILYERPQMDEEWCPQRKPLHLYYPIENEWTPFPFVVHAPFEVRMNRQNLDAENAKNKALLSEGVLQEFIVETVEEIVTHGSVLRSWFPWLVMPLVGDDSSTQKRNGMVSEFVKNLCTDLSKTPCVPTFGGEQATPDQVLLEVSETRLNAFEPVREYLVREGKDGHERLPEQAVVENGEEWLKTLYERRVLEEDRFRAAAERIGLTKLLEKTSNEEQAAKTDLISVLANIWGINSEDEPAITEVAVEIEDSEAARAYFETVEDRLSDEGSTVVGELGRHHIPLLPARDDSSSSVQSDDATAESPELDEIGYLVRAIDRNGESQIDRIVFREDSAETSRKIAPPPSAFDVFLIPFHDAWYGALDNNADEWGTTKFESDTDIYRRVAAELGGYGKNKVVDHKEKENALAYLYDGYTEINTGRRDTSAELFHPVPYQGRHYHKKFSNSVDTNGIGNLLSNEELGGITDDNYLQQVYIRQIDVPTSNGEWTPADQTVFDQAWADLFERIAQQLDSGTIDDPFEENRLGGTSAADDFRRWATAINCAELFCADDAPVLAPPEEFCDNLELTSDNEDIPDEITNDEWFWFLNFLLHLGVQVGPRIEWAWLNPSDRKTSDRRPRALFREEAAILSDGRRPDSSAELPLTLKSDELERYANVCRRSVNHPAFVVKHAPNCRDSSKRSYDAWSVYDAAQSSRRLAIPMWWRFADLPEDPDRETARAFRTAVLLLWPELSDRLFPTGWVCAGAFGNNHQVKSPRNSIPGLGLVQLRQANIWPSKSSDDDEAETKPELVQATKLVDGQRIKALDRIDYDQLKTALANAYTSEEQSPDLADVSPESDLGDWLNLSIEGLDPAAAAKQLGILLDEFDRQEYSRFRDDSFRLLRRFKTEDHLETLSEKTRRRKWIRRDISNTGTQLLVNKEGTRETRSISDVERIEATIYRETLPTYAKAQLESRGETVVEVPTSNPGPIVEILEDKSSDRITFGINRGEEPTRPIISDVSDTKIIDDSFQDELRQRVADLAAAYAVETDAVKDDVRHIEKQLDKAVTNVCVVSERDINGEIGAVKSAKWKLDRKADADADGIALISEKIDERPAPHHAVDALVHIVENEAVKDKFEVVLRAGTPMQRYTDTRREFGLGDIRRYELTELLTNCLPAITESLATAGERTDGRSVTYEFDEFLPDTDEEVKSTHEVLEAFARNETHPEPVIRNLTDALTAGSLNQNQAEGCLQAAIELTFERAHTAGLVTITDILLDEDTDVAGDLNKIAAAVDTVNLTDWSAVNCDSLRSHLMAVAMVEDFYSQLRTDIDGDEIQTIANAVLAQEPAFGSTPLDPIGDVLPEDVCSTLEIDRSLPVIVFAIYNDLTNQPLTPHAETKSACHDVLTDAVTKWCTRQHNESEKTVDTSLEEWDFCEYLAQWPDSETLSDVKNTLESEDRRTARQNKRTRKQKERAFDEGRDYGTVETGTTTESSEFTFSEVGSTSTSPTQEDTEVPAGDGRPGELNCIEMAWNQFKTVTDKQEAILEEIKNWRDTCDDGDQWRLKPTKDVFDDKAEFVDSAGVFDFNRYCDLVCDETQDETTRRKWFRMLVDVSEERGPGFDYIDPFGPHYGGDDPEAWDPSWMRRIEVKSVKGSPTAGYRVKLTGNEFRMARRTCGVCDGRRYLIRLVFGTYTDGEFDPEEWSDIDNILSQFTSGEDDEKAVETQAQTQAWDALRGGRLSISGSFE